MRSAAGRIVLGLALALVPAAAGAQEVRGRVLADDSGLPIRSADVALLDVQRNERARVATDSTGYFVIRTEPGRWLLSVRHLSYVPFVSQPFEIRRSDWADLEIRMGVDAIPLEPVRVVSTAETSRIALRERLAERTGGAFISRAEIDRSGVSRSSDLLRTVNGITLRPVLTGTNPTGDGRNLILLREGIGSGCLADIYVDGMQIPQSTTVTIDDFINPRALEAVEIYRSSATTPAEFQGAGGCGVVAFWTRQTDGGSVWSWKRFGLALGVVAFMVFRIL